jgi:hypothetical protein
MEKPLGDLSLREGAVMVPTKPYEIKTIRVRFGAQAAKE